MPIRPLLAGLLLAGLAAGRTRKADKPLASLAGKAVSEGDFQHYLASAYPSAELTGMSASPPRWR